MLEKFSSIKWQLCILLTVSLIIKVWAMCSFELIYEEAYYLTYANYPAVSQFDHPPMVGFMILLTTLGMIFKSEFFLRLGPLLLGMGSVIIIYLLGKKYRNPRTGLIAAYLASINIYIFMYCGIFIMPDDAMLFFFLLSFFFFSNIMLEDASKVKKRDIFFAFLFFGLAVYSKYQAIYLGPGVLLFIIVFNRVWFKKISIYLATIIPLIFIGLIIYGSYLLNFAGLAFQDNRVHSSIADLSIGHLFQQIGGQVAVTNGINFVIIVLAIIFFRKKKFLPKKHFWLIIFCSVPLILTVLYISLFGGTNAQWTGPAYAILLIIAAAYLDSVLKTLKFPVILTYVVLAIFIYPIGAVSLGWYYPAKLLNTGIKPIRHGRNDLRLFLYGQKQAKGIYDEYVKKNPQYKDLPLVSFSWRTTSNLNYYIGRPEKRDVYTFGGLRDLHTYYWIDETYPKLKRGSNAIYMTLTYRYVTPDMRFYKKNKLLLRAPIYLDGEIVEYLYIYEMQGYIPDKMNILENFINNSRFG
ncbi:MAG: glycosyltransferase family 39 protein [bacterium]|nr:glycosyltransferase family 39 protein [bacterium]